MSVIAHLDLDAFFASVEQLDHPGYRGKPVVVGADPRKGAGRGVVAAASYEARKFGIHSAMPIGQAYRACPGAIFVFPRFERYIELSEKVMELLAENCRAFEPISIDEAFMDLSDRVQGPEEARPILHKLKHDIQSRIGLTASAGAGSSKFIAKLASDLEKPDGLVICKEGNEKNFIKDLGIERLWGAGKKTAARLRALGYSKIGQLASSPLWRIREAVGNKIGTQLWQLANGIDERIVQSHHVRKSIGKERTFNSDTDDIEALRAQLSQLALEVSRVLQMKKWNCKQISLKIRYHDFSTYTRSAMLKEPTDQAAVLLEQALKRLQEVQNEKGMKKVRLLGISTSHFAQLTGWQLSLFSD